MIDIDKVEAALQRAANSESKTGRLMVLVRVVAPHFVAGFETDGVVRNAAPILHKLVGLTEDEARQIIQRNGWKASIIPDRPTIKHNFANFGGSNAGSFEVHYAGGRKFFYYDDNAGRRAVGGYIAKEQAFAAAQAFLNSKKPGETFASSSGGDAPDNGAR